MSSPYYRKHPDAPSYIALFSYQIAEIYDEDEARKNLEKSKYVARLLPRRLIFIFMLIRFFFLMTIIPHQPGLFSI